MDDDSRNDAVVTVEIRLARARWIIAQQRELIAKYEAELLLGAVALEAVGASMHGSS
jgi:hypothetical protein